MSKPILGIIGGGQLGSMLAIAANKLEIKTVIFCNDIDAPAQNFSNDFVQGEYNDKNKINEFLSKVDVVTYEFENIPYETLNEINKIKPVLPKPSVNRIIQHRLAEKDFINNLNIRTTRYVSIEKKSEMDSVEDFLPGILKTTTLGYDGKGQHPINSLENLDSIDVDYSKGYILEKLEGYTFIISPKSFFQTNTKQAEKLYSVTRDFAELNGTQTVYDLYCGTGSIGIFVSDKAKKIIGIETVPEAIEDAKKNAALNNIQHTSFFAGDVIKICDDQFFAENGKPDVVITDPPRAGMHEKLVQKLKNELVGRKFTRGIDFYSLGWNRPEMRNMPERSGKIDFIVRDVNLVDGKPELTIDILRGGFTTPTRAYLSTTYVHPSLFSEGAEMIIDREMKGLLYPELLKRDDLMFKINHPNAKSQETEIVSSEQ